MLPKLWLYSLLALRKFEGHKFAEAGSPALSTMAVPESKIKFVGFVLSKRSL